MQEVRITQADLEKYDLRARELRSSAFIQSMHDLAGLSHGMTRAARALSGRLRQTKLFSL